LADHFSLNATRAAWPDYGGTSGPAPLTLAKASRTTNARLCPRHKLGPSDQVPGRRRVEIACATGQFEPKMKWVSVIYLVELAIADLKSDLSEVLHGSVMRKSTDSENRSARRLTVAIEIGCQHGGDHNEHQ
jgi:hypothetical protein